MGAQLLDFEFGGLFTSFAQSRVPHGRAFVASNVSLERGIIEARAGYAVFGQRAGAAAGDVGWGIGYGLVTQNEVHQLFCSNVPTSGTFTITWNGQTTGNIAYNCAAAGTDTGDGSSGNPYKTVQAALEALSNINLGDVFCYGGPFPGTPIYIEWRAQYANTDVAATTVTSSVTPGSVSSGVFITGGTSEELLVPIQHQGDTTATLYSVNVTTGTFTQIGTGLTASDWHFAQYGNRIYAINATNGMHSRQLGGAWSLNTNRPTAPTSAPSVSIDYKPTSSANSHIPDFSAATYGDFTGWGTNPTITGTSNGMVKIVCNANLASAQASFTIAFSGTLNAQFIDFHALHFSYASADFTIDPFTVEYELVNNDPTPITLTPEKKTTKEYNATNGYIIRNYQFLDTQRTDRDNVKKLKITLHFEKATSTKSFVIYVRHYPQWPNDDSSLSLDDGPVKDAIHYAYSYVSAAGLESALSPEIRSRIVPLYPTGSRQTINARGSTDANMNPGNLRFYRLEKSTGKWRRLPAANGTYNFANSATGGTVSCEDRYMEHEIGNFPEYSTGLLWPGMAPTCLGVWKQCLAVGTGRLVYLSGQGRPEYWAPSPDFVTAASLPDDTTDSRPITEYVADNRGEDVRAVVGQDSIYLVGDYSTYAKVGDTPAGASPPRRLPGSRGVVGSRAACPLGGGVALVAQDGVWYYSVGRGFSGEDNGAMVEREETSELRSSFSTWYGLGAGSAVLFEHNDELWAFNGASYLCNSRSRKWSSGTYADSVKAAMAHRRLGRLLLDAKGRILKVSSAYTTDAGAAISWEYETGWLDGPRTQVKGLQIHGEGTPEVTVTVDDGLGGTTVVGPLTKPSGGMWVLPLATPPGFRVKFKFSGTAGETVERVLFEFEAAPGARRN